MVKQLHLKSLFRYSQLSVYSRGRKSQHLSIWMDRIAPSPKRLINRNVAAMSIGRLVERAART
jgi:hypothetical protein